MNQLKTIERLIDSLTKLPSVGRRSAERMAFAMMEMSEDDLNEFIKSIEGLKTNIHHCPKCNMIIDSEGCPICDNPDRNHKLLMVVSSSKDIFAIEKSGGFKGIYHVLNGEISLSKGLKPEALNIPALLNRIEEEKIEEVILATNPTLEGETTALYLAKLLSKQNVTTTRLAYGLQMGGNIDYTDQITLLKALEGRRKI